MKNHIKCTNCGASYDFICNSQCPHCKPEADFKSTLELIKLQKQQRDAVKGGIYDNKTV